MPGIYLVDSNHTAQNQATSACSPRNRYMCNFIERNRPIWFMNAQNSMIVDNTVVDIRLPYNSIPSIRTACISLREIWSVNRISPSPATAQPHRDQQRLRQQQSESTVNEWQTLRAASLLPMSWSITKQCPQHRRHRADQYVVSATSSMAVSLPMPFNTTISTPGCAGTRTPL